MTEELQPEGHESNRLREGRMTAEAEEEDTKVGAHVLKWLKSCPFTWRPHTDWLKCSECIQNDQE